MNFKHSALACAVGAFASALFATTAQAQTAGEFEQLRQELKRLREEVQSLKAAQKPLAEAPALNDRVEQLEIKSKDAVVAGDIGGGFRIPGSETSVRLYGYGEAHLIHDLKSPGPSDLFTDLSSQPLDSAGVPRGRTKLTASTSRFGVETSTPTGAGTFNTRLEMDFYSYDDTYGQRNRLRVRHAYGEYHGFLVGQTWSTFMDLDDLPETVDFNGPIGAPFSRRTMIRYTYGDPKAGYKLTAALEDPQDQAGGHSQSERLPQFIARFDKSFDWGAVNVRGLVHEKRSFAESRRGYGLGIGGSYKLSDKDLLMAQFTRVDGDFDQLYGSNSYAIDGTTGAITFDRNRGLVAGWTRNFSDSLRGTVAFGMNKGEVAAAFDNRSLKQVFINLIYSPIKNVELGGEYIHGRRETFTGEAGTMSRIDLMGRYSF